MGLDEILSFVVAVILTWYVLYKLFKYFGRGLMINRNCHMQWSEWLRILQKKGDLEIFSRDNYMIIGIPKHATELLVRRWVKGVNERTFCLPPLNIDDEWSYVFSTEPCAKFIVTENGDFSFVPLSDNVKITDNQICITDLNSRKLVIRIDK